MNTDFPRRQMVEQQIRSWDVFDENVLNAFASVRRERFVPAQCSNAAYADAEIPLPHEQCMLRPSIAGRILQALEIQPDDHVLEIGTGTGYLTACIAQIAGSVTSIELFADFVAQAEKNLAEAEIENVTLQCMDATQRLPAGKFDAIAVTASVSEMDERMLAALKPGGRLFVVVGESPAKSAVLIKRGADESFASTELFETDIPALVNIKYPATFLF